LTVQKTNHQQKKEGTGEKNVRPNRVITFHCPDEVNSGKDQGIGSKLQQGRCKGKRFLRGWTKNRESAKKMGSIENVPGRTLQR